MSDEPRKRLTDEQFLDVLFDEIGESIKNASDEEILEDARLAGDDVEQIAADTLALLKRTLEQHKACTCGRNPESGYFEACSEAHWDAYVAHLEQTRE